MREYRRDDLRGAWVCREYASEEWVDCGDDPIASYLDEHVLPIMRRDFMSKYRGGFIRDIMFYAHTDMQGRLIRHVTGLAVVTPMYSRYTKAYLEMEAELSIGGSIDHRIVVRAVESGKTKPRRVKSYVRPFCDVSDDMTV